ncbi:MAG: hypothetical protein J6M62_11310 [Selenomonadaceae bacterium]|nr:hypothetical protein [Selenomonadaceae bacterium]MBO6305642.1 hypothetical protein [Selenomonadaceae bacterium]
MMNQMAEVAKLFGKELGEKFTIICDDDLAIWDACFSEEGVACFAPNNGAKTTLPVTSNVLKKLLTGTYRIKKTPWKPKCGEIYFAPLIASSKKCAKFYKTATDIDDVVYQHGLMCKTPEQAEEIAKAMIKVARKMQGFDDEEGEE